MPPSGHRHEPATVGNGGSSFKHNPRLLSLLLKAIIMTLITSLFFVFLGLAAIILLHLCLAGGLLHRRRNLSPYPSAIHRHHHHHHHHQHQQNHHQQNQHQSPIPGLSPSDLRRVPKFRFLDSGKRLVGSFGKQKEGGLIDCAICLDEVKEGQWCRKLIGCGHVFHKGCVDTWLLKVAACPVCRRAVGDVREGGCGRDLKVDGFQGLLRL